MPKVIYTSIINDNIHSVIKILQNQYQWTPEVLVSAGYYKNSTINNFAGSFHIDANELRKGNFDYSKLPLKIPIDHDVLKRLSYYESNFLNWIEDTNGRNFSFSERRRFFYDILMYWNSVLKSFKPDLFFSFSWPHTVADYALYLVSKHIYSIPTLFLDVIPFFNTKDRLVFLSYDNMSSTIRTQKENNKNNIKIDPLVDQYLISLQKKQDPFVHSNILEFFQDHKFDIKQILNDLKNLLKYLLTFKIFQKPDIFFKKNSKPFGDRSRMNHIEYFIFKYKVMIKNFLLKNYYKSISNTLDFKKKYIYYPGPYIPEAMSNIVPGKFEDPFLILEMLSYSLPKDWKVYYKEHPATFTARSKGSLGKDKLFFEKLKSYKFVEIAQPHESTFKLIDNAKAVITAGGTAGWEAIVRGKPCMLFGSLWYQDCPEIFKIETLDDLNTALKKIENNFKPNFDNIKYFAQGIYDSLLKNGELINSKRAKIKQNSENDLDLSNIARDINSLYMLHYNK